MIAVFNAAALGYISLYQNHSYM